MARTDTKTIAQTITATTVGLSFAVALAGCGGMGSSNGRTTSDAQMQTMDGNTCNVVVASQPNGGHLHTTDCAPVIYASNPPSSGTHYPDWAKYKTYSAPVPWGFLVHCLEHGAIDIVYNCADGWCP